MAIKVPGEKPASETGTLLTNATLVHSKWHQPRPPAPTIDWQYWNSLFDMQLWQALALSCGIIPDYPNEGQDAEYDRRMVIALNHMQPGALLADIKRGDRPHLTRVKLADVARLAAALDWPLPDAFPRLQPPMASTAKAIEATEPRQDTETLAFTQATNEKKQGPTPLKSRDIAFVFSGLRWTEQEWMKPLGDKPKWLQACVAIPAQRGVSQTHWNPVLIGAALLGVGDIKANQVRGRFQSKPQLIPWLDEWKTYEADYLDND